jgi:hypothetical protein
MASLLLEGGGEKPGFWRELGADPIRTALYHEPQNLPSDLSYHQQVLVLTFLDHSPSALLEVPLPLLRNVGCRQV